MIDLWCALRWASLWLQDPSAVPLYLLLARSTVRSEQLSVAVVAHRNRRHLSFSAPPRTTARRWLARTPIRAQVAL